MPDDWRMFGSLSLLGSVLVEQKKFTEAEPLLLSGYEGMKQREAIIRDRYKVFSETLQYLVRLYEETNQPVRAAEWKQKLAEVEKAMAEKK